MPAKKTILLIATLDTKGEEANYIKEKIEQAGKRVLILDCGLAGKARWVKGDITRYAVAGKAGVSYKKLQSLSRIEAEEAMAKGLASLVRELYNSKKFDAALGIGGYDGSLLASAGMRELPVGFPKLILSAMACGDIKFGEYVGTRDITIMPSVYDLVGVNSLTCKIFDNAIAAICGMVDRNVKPGVSARNLISLTMFGQTNPCGACGKRMLEKEGYEVVGFHPNQVGGTAMEEMIKAGVFCGVWDLTTQEISEEAAFGIQPARSGMLTKESAHFI
ncbi:MAG: Tm-1-like ATP-binding domain-containing protein, partial [Spirochaetota bacterium]